jgi:hypothetical protein
MIGCADEGTPVRAGRGHGPPQHAANRASIVATAWEQRQCFRRHRHIDVDGALSAFVGWLPRLDSRTLMVLLAGERLGPTEASPLEGVALILITRHAPPVEGGAA